MDPIPIFSQVKSLVQAIAGNTEGARKTQENFSRWCPVVSQGRSFVEWIVDGPEAARETQKEFGRFAADLVDGVPAVGHVKGTIHYAMGNKERGDRAMKASSHASAVVAGGVVGMLVGGPVGAVIGGASSGAAIDCTITGVESAIKDEFVPYGVLAPLSDPTDAGKWCDAVGGVAIDGMVGRAAGVLVEGMLPAKTAGAAILEDATGALEMSPSAAGATGAARTTGAAQSSSRITGATPAGAELVTSSFEKTVGILFTTVSAAKTVLDFTVEGRELLMKIKENVIYFFDEFGDLIKTVAVKWSELKEYWNKFVSKQITSDKSVTKEGCMNIRIKVADDGWLIYLNGKLVMQGKAGKFSANGNTPVQNDELYSLADDGNVIHVQQGKITEIVNNTIEQNLQDVLSCGNGLDTEYIFDGVISLKDETCTLTVEKETDSKAWLKK